ncbi:hypothetical protein MITS9508_00428 [Synechococcus sp. MIT S9508]|nr:hypothetical protein MITS9508_00428 [Synechococcus sp. MIT S9508]
MPLHHPLKLTCRVLLLSLGFAITEAATRVNADSTIAHCQLSHHNPSVQLQSGPCRFSQRQGYVTIMFREQTSRTAKRDCVVSAATAQQASASTCPEEPRSKCCGDEARAMDVFAALPSGHQQLIGVIDPAKSICRSTQIGMMQLDQRPECLLDGLL